MDWEKYYSEALSYRKAAIGGLAKSKLGSNVLYNLISLAIENLLTALLFRDKMLPEHSSIGSMLRELKKNYDVPATFFQEARLINKYMNFCSLDILPYTEPSSEDLLTMRLFMDNLKEWVEIQLEIVSEVQ